MSSPDADPLQRTATFVLQKALSIMWRLTPWPVRALVDGLLSLVALCALLLLVFCCFVAMYTLDGINGVRQASLVVLAVPCAPLMPRRLLRSPFWSAFFLQRDFQQCLDNMRTASDIFEASDSRLRARKVEQPALIAARVSDEGLRASFETSLSTLVRLSFDVSELPLADQLSGYNYIGQILEKPHLARTPAACLRIFYLSIIDRQLPHAGQLVLEVLHFIVLLLGSPVAASLKERMQELGTELMKKGEAAGFKKVSAADRQYWSAPRGSAEAVVHRDELPAPFRAWLDTFERFEQDPSFSALQHLFEPSLNLFQLELDTAKTENKLLEAVLDAVLARADLNRRFELWREEEEAKQAR